MANAVKMHIEKFGKEVLIDIEHPLAALQRKIDAEKAEKALKKTSNPSSKMKTDTKAPSSPPPAATTEPASPTAPPEIKSEK